MEDGLGIPKISAGWLEDQRYKDQYCLAVLVQRILENCIRPVASSMEVKDEEDDRCTPIAIEAWPTASCLSLGLYVTFIAPLGQCLLHRVFQICVYVE